jgi:hypothetical protein
MSKLPVFIFIAGAAGAVLVACAADGPQPARAAAADSARQCFNARNVYNFHAVNDRTVLVEVGTKRIYELQIVGVCPEIDWTQKLAIRTTGGSSWICRGLDAELVVPSPSGVERCPVVGTRELTPAEVEAYRASRRR